MHIDLVDLRAFYADRLGLVARRLIGRRLREYWPSLAGERLVGIGYATPYLKPFAAETEALIAFMPAEQGVVNWPSQGPNATALVQEDDLPLPDASIDRVLAVHCLEMAENAEDVLREIWRILTPGGRVILVVPNRRGIWAHFETTPFGQGSPFSRGQLTTLFRETMFTPLRWSEALSMPPVSRRFVRTGANWERLGAAFWPGFGGVLIVEATKLLYRGIPTRRRARERLAPALQPALLPPGAARGVGNCALPHEQTLRHLSESWGPWNGRNSLGERPMDSSFSLEWRGGEIKPEWRRFRPPAERPLRRDREKHSEELQRANRD